ARLARELEAKGPRYKPRTRHLNPDGTPRYTNRLILETSPYLLQHAHNPVNWYPWGDEAFDTARKQDRPVLLSIGYSSCYWCHVMERESFEDPEIARYLNENFVAIKVDREERPDLDGVYMRAVEAMGVGGGWPMTTALTPDRKPFFGATYIPPRRGARGARQGFWEILHMLHEQYATRREAVVARAAEISRRVARTTAPEAPGDLPGAAAIADAVRSLAGGYDPVNGGFGAGRKFPRPVTLELLLRYQRRTGDRRALAMVEHTLERMAAGGIHDQIGGGFHRYAVEPTWSIPHFEKMLYDNAQLASLYLEAFQATGRKEFARVARRTLDYVAREMSDTGGGFFSATDSETPSPSGEGEEGLFFTWTPDEIRDVLGEKTARGIIAYYGVTRKGNFEGRNVMRLAGTAQAVASTLGMSPDTLAREVERARKRLYEARSRREPPSLDTKIVTAWNALMLSAFARGSMVLGDAGYRDRAVAAARFLLEHLEKDGRLARSYAGGRPGKPGVLSDYSFLVAGLLDLYEATFDDGWLRRAIALNASMQEHFEDKPGGGFFMTADDADRLLVREKPHFDGAEPSGNSVAVLNLLRLHEFTGDERYRKAAERTFRAFSRRLSGGRSSAALMLCALDFYLDEPKEIVLVAPDRPEQARPFLDRLARTFVPNRVVVTTMAGDPLERLAGLMPLVKDRGVKDGKATAYVCVNRVCKLPTTDPEEFARQIAGVTPYQGFTPSPLGPPARSRR
ncbi:MAG: thioredoxin domain-containing protein, partial [Acidobacteriota bacterium]